MAFLHVLLPRTDRETQLNVMLLSHCCAGIVYKGDGSNMYLKMSPRSRRMTVVLGDPAGQIIELP